jgi:hypothetical protein
LFEAIVNGAKSGIVDGYRRSRGAGVHLDSRRKTPAHEDAPGT